MGESRTLLDDLLVQKFNVVTAVKESSGMDLALRVSDQHGFHFVWKGGETMEVVFPDGTKQEDSVGDEPTMVTFLAACQSYDRALG